MKINKIITIIIITSLVIYLINYDIFLNYLSLIWSLASILIIYASIKYTLRYHFIQLKLNKIISALKSKSNTFITPISSMCITLAAKIGVGSLSGIALAIYYGGIGTIFWICLISLLVSVNAFVESQLGIKYREKINNIHLGGPSYYIKKCLNNNYLSKLYGIMIIITYSFLFLSIQTNTIIVTGINLNVNINLIMIILVIITLLIIMKGLKSISKVNTYLVPIMLSIYLCIGLYIFIKAHRKECISSNYSTNYTND